MKNSLAVVVILALIGVSCSSSSEKKAVDKVKTEVKKEKVVKKTIKKDEPETSHLSKSVSKEDSEILKKVGDWADLNVEGYGVAVAEVKGKKIGKPIKCKIIKIKKNRFKLKALEKVKLVNVKSCNQMAIRKGQTWWEKEADFWKSKEEALKVLKKRGYN